MATINPQTAYFFEQLFRRMHAPPAVKVLGEFQRKYPRLMRRVGASVGNLGPGLGVTGVKPRAAGQSMWSWLRAEAQPQIVLSARQGGIPTGHTKTWSPEKLMRFAAGHEMQHAREALGRTNATFVGKAALNKLFVPYGWRANEWRANTVGAQVAKLTPQEIYRMRKSAILTGAAGAGVRTALGGGAYALYRGRRRKA